MSEIDTRTRVLITGSRGYIGTNLERYLLDRGYHVFTADLLNGTDAMDISTPKLLLNAISHVVHLGAISGIAACEENKEDAVIKNVLTSIRLFECANAANANVTFASTQAAKDPNANFYACTKYMAEVAAKRINSLNQRNIKVLRFSNVYGGLNYLETKQTVISQFTRAKLKHNPVTVYGDGEQVRDFIHVEDVCEAIWRSIVWSTRINEPIDIGTGVGTSIIDLTKIFDVPFTLHKDSDRIGIKSNIADTTKAHELLAFKARKDLATTIRKEFLNV